jgi:anthranilate synthase
MPKYTNSDYLSYPNTTFIPKQTHLTGILYPNKIELNSTTKLGKNLQNIITKNESYYFDPVLNAGENVFQLKKIGQLKILNDLQSIAKENSLHCFTILSFEAAHIIEDLPIYDNDTVLLEFIITECDELSTESFLKLINDSNYYCNNTVPNCEIFSDSSDQYLKNYEKVVEHFKAGDVYEFVLSRKIEFKTDTSSMFQYLKKPIAKQRAPYRFGLNFFNTKICGASPEILIDIHGDKVIMKPISGSVRRTSSTVNLTDEEQEELNKLYLSEKEKCELDMLIDLARNDLNHFCKKVTVSNYREALILEHIIHTQATVSGKLKPEFNSIDAILSSINAGTLVGVPKRKAMEIISNLEKKPRGYYGGNLVHFKPDGNLVAIILIRTAYLNNKILKFQAGSSIIIEANDQYEFWECGSKLKHLLSLIGQDHLCFNEKKPPQVVLNIQSKKIENLNIKKKLLMIENFDSFSYNLVALFENCGCEIDVIRNTVKDFDFSCYDGIILSPGPSHPKEAGYLIEHIQNLISKKPIFGVCLGFQAIVEACGGKVSKLQTPVHGKARNCYVENSKVLFQSLPSEFTVARYHSLYAETIPNCIKIVAYDENHIPLALEILDHKTNVCAVQFHPESFLTGIIGEKIIKNWLETI